MLKGSINHLSKQLLLQKDDAGLTYGIVTIGFDADLGPGSNSRHVDKKYQKDEHEQVPGSRGRRINEEN